MPAERLGDPSVTQALEQGRDTLRLEESALKPLQHENARLREQLERLQSEREALRREMEALRREQPESAPRLPERLALPLELRAPVTLRRRLQWAIPSLVVTGFLLWGPWQRSLPLVVLGLLVLGIAPLLLERRSRPRCRFGENGIELVRADKKRFVPYTEVLDAEVHVSRSQRRRGVGTVVVTCKSVSWEVEGEPLLLKDVPEPERLAQWIRSMCPPGK